MIDRKPLFNLLGQRKNIAAAPQGARIYAIGDIHGCLDLLEQLLARIDDDQKKQGGTSEQYLVFLGDYVDRGPDSQRVIETLINLQRERPGVVALKGNHEATMLDFIDHPEDTAHWLDWGGEETIASYGVDPILGRTPEDLAADLLNAMPRSHELFLRDLPVSYRAGDYLFVHAGIRPGVALEDQAEEDMLWIRKRFHNAPRETRPDVTVVHGHEPIKKPLDAGWRIAVDTGACWSGKLTAVVLEGEKRRFIQTG